MTYQRIGDTVEFELSGKAGWAGVGFSDDQNMVNTSRVRAMFYISSWEPQEHREWAEITGQFPGNHLLIIL